MDIYSLMHKWVGYQINSGKKKLTLEERNKFLSEISYDSANRIEQWFENNPELLSFGKLFDGKLRKIINLDSPDAKKLRHVIGVLKSEGWKVPMHSEWQTPNFEVKSVKHIDTELQGAGGGDRSYFKEIANLVLEKVEERVIPKGPRAGEKITSRKNLSISKIIARSKALREDDKKWWQSKQQYYAKDQNWLQIENLFNKTQKGSQHVMLSRHPMDILRMSDIDKIQSCHSEHGEYFECAVHEAQGNGPIAYLVDSDDLADFLHRETGEFEDWDIADEPDEPDFGTPEQQIEKMKKYYIENPRFLKRLDRLFNTNKEPWRIEDTVKNSWALNKFDPDLFMQVMKNHFAGADLRDNVQGLGQAQSEKSGVFDLEDLNDRLNTLDDQEVFRDKARDVRGMGATARLRLRKFEDTDTETEFAVPERIVYGPHPPGFVSVVMDWAWKGQQQLFKTPDGSDWWPDKTEVGRHGGRWEDTKDGKLLNLFFDNLQDFNVQRDGFEEYSNVRVLGDFDESSDIARVEGEVADKVYLFNSEYSDKNVTLNANVVEMDDDGYGDSFNITARAIMSFAYELPIRSNAQQSRLAENENPQFKEFPAYERSEELYTNGKLEHIRKAIITRLSRGVEQVSDLIDWRIVAGKWLMVHVEVTEDDMEGTVEGLESFIADLELYYEDDPSPYEQGKEELAKAFRAMGYLAEPDIRIFAKSLKDLDDELEVFEVFGVEFDGDEIEEIEDPIELECNFRPAFTIDKKIISMLNKDLLKQMFGAGHVRQRQTTEMHPSMRSTYFTIKPIPGGKFSQLIRKEMGPLLRKARIQVQKDMEGEHLAANQAKFKSFFLNVSRGEFGLKIRDEAIDYYIKFEFPKNESKEYLFALLDFAKYLDKNIGMIDKAFKEAIKEIFADYVDYIKAHKGNQTQDDEEFEEKV